MLLAPGIGLAQVQTLDVVDGYDEKDDKTLVELGKLSIVQISDDDRLPLEAGFFPSLPFEQTLPPEGDHHLN